MTKILHTADIHLDSPLTVWDELNEDQAQKTNFHDTHKVKRFSQSSNRQMFVQPDFGFLRVC